MRILLLLLTLVIAAPAWAAQTSYYHIPASAFRPTVNWPGQSCGSLGFEGLATCGACTPNPIGVDGKAAWSCAATPGTDPGIMTDQFSLPPYALSTQITVAPVFREAGVGSYNVGFYGYFEVTPTTVTPADWAANTGQACAPSLTTTTPSLHANRDNTAVINVRACDQTTNASCPLAPVTACTGLTGFHGVLIVRRDMTSFAPSPSSLDITEVIVGVTTP